MGTASTT